MLDIEIKTVMDREKLAGAIHKILDAGVELLEKPKLEGIDYAKIKVLRTLGSHINAAVIMVQQETMQLRAMLVAERMKQLGYTGDQKSD